MVVRDFLPTATWPWCEEPRRGRDDARPSVDPEAAAAEASGGLTAGVLRRYLDRFPAIVGPLRHRPDVFRPLSLRGGRLTACELLAVPDDVPDWKEWLRDVEHVQTSSPAVCRALAASVPSFTVAGAECVEVLGGSGARVVDAKGPPFPNEAWCPAPFLDPRAFVPVVAVAYRTWWCWDLDEERPALVATGEEPSYFVGHDDRILRPEVDLLGPLPLRRVHPPSAHLAHAAVDGAGWTCGLHAAGRMQPLVITRPPGQIAILHPMDRNRGDQGDELAWRFVHEPERAFEDDPNGAVGGSLAVLQLHEGSRLTLRWGGEHRLFRLRNGELAALTEPHTLAREATARGIPPESITGPMRGIITRGIGAEPEAIELAMDPGDRYLICTRHSEELFDRAALRQLLLGDARQSAVTVMHALARARRTDAALFFTPEATFLHTHPGWFSDLAVDLESPASDPWHWPPFPHASALEAQNPFDRPQRFAIYRIATTMETAHSWSSRMWERALRGALDRFCAERFAPRRHDLFRTWTAGGSPLSLQFDGARWLPVMSSYRPQEGRVAEGRLRFREDRPTPALEAWLARGEDQPIDAEELEQVAAREGFVELALWLKLEREHVEGHPGLGLRAARDRVSLLVRRRLRQLRFSRRPVAHEVDAPRLLREPTFYHQCRLRYRSLVSEIFEDMRSAGAWWSPAAERGEDRYHVADMDVEWRSDGFSGYGHMGMSHALATGVATPYTPPPAPRRMTAEDIRLDRLRAGVPVRAVLAIQVESYRWLWRGRDIEPPADRAGLGRAARCHMKVDAIVMRLERLAILEVIEVIERRDLDA